MSFKFVWINFKLFAFEVNIGIFGAPYRNSTLCVFQTNTSVSFCTVRMGRRSSFCHVYLICTERRRMFRWTFEEKQKFLGFFSFSFILCKCWRDDECKQEGTNLTPRSVENCPRDVLDFKDTRRCAEEDVWWSGVGAVLLLLLPQKKQTSFCQLCFFLNSIYCEMLTIPQVLFCQLKLQTEEESRSSSTFTAMSSLLTAGFLCIVTWSQFIGRVHVCCPQRQLQRCFHVLVNKTFKMLFKCDVFILGAETGQSNSVIGNLLISNFFGTKLDCHVGASPGF